jgi:hypothetical protein
MPATTAAVSATSTATTTEPVASPSATQLVFATGSSEAQSLTVMNAGPGDLNVSALTVGGQDSGDFAASGNCATVAAGSQCTVTVVFTPQAAGPRSAMLQIASNAAGGTVTVPLVAQAATSGAALVSSTSTLDFAPVIAGATSADLEVMFTNTGTAVATIGQLQATGGNFTLTSDHCSGTTLAPGATCTLMAQFAPQQAGTQAGQITASGSSVTAMPTVKLAGTALVSSKAGSVAATGSSGGGGAVGVSGLLVLALATLRRRRAAPRC